MLGVIGEFLTDYGERELRPLAATDPRHLVLAGIHSLRIALHVLAQEEVHAGPVVVTEMGDPHHAAHVVANLAVAAEQAGERVLIVEASSMPGVLSAIFASDEQAIRPMALEVDELSEKRDSDERLDKGRIRFLFRAGSTNEFNGETLPVTAKFIHDFDRAFIHVDDVAGAKYLLNEYGTGIGLLVCSSDVGKPALTKEVEDLHGVVLCDYRIDASVYSESGNPI